MAAERYIFWGAHDFFAETWGHPRDGGWGLGEMDLQIIGESQDSRIPRSAAPADTKLFDVTVEVS